MSAPAQVTVIKKLGRPVSPTLPCLLKSICAFANWTRLMDNLN